MEKEVSTLAQSILNAFTKEVIISSISKEEFVRLNEKAKISYRTQPLALKATPALAKTESIELVQSIPKAESGFPLVVEEASVQEVTPMQISQRQFLEKPKINYTLSGSGPEKIKVILSDPAVSSLECPGPDKNLVVNRAGLIQPTSSVLTKEEIDAIITDFSERTRIPIIKPGVFKATLGGVLITSVLSDFVGTKFVIQKRLPPMM